MMERLHQRPSIILYTQQNTLRQCWFNIVSFLCLMESSDPLVLYAYIVKNRDVKPMQSDCCHSVVDFWASINLAFCSTFYLCDLINPTYVVVFYFKISGR